MSNSNNSSETQNDQTSVTPSTSSRSTRRSGTSQGGIRRSSGIKFGMNRRILALPLEERRSLISAMANAMLVEESPDSSFRTEGDWVIHTIDLHVPNAETSLPSDMADAMNTEDSAMDTDNSSPPERNNDVNNENSAELNNTLVGNSVNRSWRSVFQNLFRRIPSSGNRGA